MTHWNHRMVKSEDGIEIREVHYTDGGKPFGHGGSVVMATDIDSLRWMLTQMILATGKPVLEWEMGGEDGLG